MKRKKGKRVKKTLIKRDSDSPSVSSPPQSKSDWLTAPVCQSFSSSSAAAALRFFASPQKYVRCSSRGGKSMRRESKGERLSTIQHMTPCFPTLFRPQRSSLPLSQRLQMSFYGLLYCCCSRSRRKNTLAMSKVNSMSPYPNRLLPFLDDRLLSSPL